MKILIIDGCPRKCNTWKIVEKAIDEIKRIYPETEFDEVVLARENLPFCSGCSNCFRLGPEKCPHYNISGNIIKKIDEADGVIICSTTFNWRETALLKNLFDHLCYMLHRPYFYQGKALVITSAGGTGQGKAANSIASTLTGIGFNRCYKAAFASYSWNAFEPSSNDIIKIRNITRKFSGDVYSGILHSPKFINIIPYNIMRGMGQLYADDSQFPTADGEWWTDECRRDYAYFPQVKMPFYKRWFGNLFYHLGKSLGRMKKLQVTYKK